MSEGRKDTGTLIGCFVSLGITGDSLVRTKDSLMHGVDNYASQMMGQQDDPLKFLLWAGAYAALITSPIIAGYAIDVYGGRVKGIVYKADSRLKGLLKE